MNAIKFIQDNGVDKAREVVEGAPDRATTVKPSLDFKHFMYGICEEAGGAYILLSDLKRLVEGVDLINSVGGLTIAKKITFQKRLRNEKATHFIQHPENQKLIQLFVRNQSKPEAAIKFDLFEQAIADYESIGGEHV